MSALTLSKFYYRIAELPESIRRRMLELNPDTLSPELILLTT